MNALTATEKGELLDALLTARPDLRGQAEELATRRLSTVDPIGVADGVESTLRFVAIDGLNDRAGYQPGIGYVHPVEAAAEILDELLQPFLDDLQRHARLGMTAAATEMAVGIMHGLHRCRDGGSESLLEYSPDFADERAAEVIRRCRALAVDLPVDDLVDALTGWETLFGDGRSTS
ncbi:hypothetical protein [Pseudonocardia hydrocarbonoxydans]|uniref:hypothetical protein n=1 Tax=Pseudonocardia hydrocarbonoxydans TaxID=76726 RepID=UPI001476AC4C|nr:hypothetical protein [Pseudonocardia hydrocarbonoxydans]